jgi:hypothetical protein
LLYDDRWEAGFQNDIVLVRGMVYL